MIVNKVISGLYTFAIFVGVCNAFGENNPEYYEDLKYIEQKHENEYANDFQFVEKTPSFQKKLYTADIDGVSLQLHGPVILDNCDYISTTFEMDLSQSSYLPVSDAPLYTSSANNCTLLFPKIFVKRIDKDEGPYAGFITIKALHENNVLDVTSVILLPMQNKKNFKIIFNIDGTEYIILNYFYLKIVFLGLLATTLILFVVEIKDIYDKYNANRYKQIENETNI